MNQNSTTTTTEVPLHILLRRRREELSLYQAQIAEALHVTPECIGQWECGRRRMELVQASTHRRGFAARRQGTVRQSAGGVPPAGLCRLVRP